MSSPNPKGFESLPDEHMVEVPRDFFFEGMPLPAAIYLKINPGNYLRIGKKGDKAAFSNLHAYNNPNIGIFVKDIEYAPFIQHVTAMTSKVMEQKQVPDAVKMKFLSGLTGDAIHSLEKSSFTSVAKVQKVANLVNQMAHSMSGFTDVLDFLAQLPNTESKHAMTTCFIAMLLCEEMNVTLPLAQEKVAMGSLLHDVGLKFVPKSILEKPRHLLSPEELHTFEQHPIRGVEMLRDVKDIPSDVLLIVAEHHETSTGTGFPKRIRDVKISPLGRIVALSNYFSGLIFSQKPGGKDYSADEAIAYIENIIGQPFNKQAFSALKNIINKKHLEDKI